jgi:hypothetical protein
MKDIAAYYGQFKIIVVPPKWDFYLNF